LISSRNKLVDWKEKAMPIITISRGSYSKGKEVADRVAQRLGYEVVSREVVLEASEEFNVPEIKLVRAIHDAPSILDRLSHRKERYIAYIRAALLQHFRKGKVVYHGLAGQFFVRSIPHVLKVRVISDMDDRIKLEMEREGISRTEALRVLKKDDEERRKWSQHLYGIDTRDPSLYDLVIHVHKITVDEAADIVCNTAGLEHFQTTVESAKALDDLTLAAEVKAALFRIDYSAKVTSMDGSVSIEAGSMSPHQFHKVDEIRSAAKNVPGVKDISVKAVPVLPISE